MNFTNPIYIDEDIIESSDDKRVSSLIGKKVYASWSKDICLYRANHNYIDLQQDLLRVDPENTIAPFVVGLPVYKHDDIRNATTEPVSISTPYIIGVKEFKEVLSRFATEEEFLGAYYKRCLEKSYDYLAEV